MKFNKLVEQIDSINPQTGKKFKACEIEFELKDYYLPIGQKIDRIKFILEKSIEEKDGIYIRNLLLEEIYTVMEVCQQYGNIEFELSEFNDTNYDLIIKNKIYDAIYSRSSWDIGRFKTLLNNSAESQLKVLNSIEGIIATGINKLLEKLPDEKTINKVIKKVQSFMNDENSKDLTQNILKIVKDEKLDKKV